jgi:hypothetical protein
MLMMFDAMMKSPLTQNRHPPAPAGTLNTVTCGNKGEPAMPDNFSGRSKESESMIEMLFAEKGTWATPFVHTCTRAWPTSPRARQRVAQLTMPFVK